MLAGDARRAAAPPTASCAASRTACRWRTSARRTRCRRRARARAPGARAGFSGADALARFDARARRGSAARARPLRRAVRARAAARACSSSSSATRRTCSRRARRRARSASWRRTSRARSRRRADPERAPQQPRPLRPGRRRAQLLLRAAARPARAGRAAGRAVRELASTCPTYIARAPRLIEPIFATRRLPAVARRARAPPRRDPRRASLSSAARARRCALDALRLFHHRELVNVGLLDLDAKITQARGRGARSPSSPRCVWRAALELARGQLARTSRSAQRDARGGASSWSSAWASSAAASSPTAATST